MRHRCSQVVSSLLSYPILVLSPSRPSLSVIISSFLFFLKQFLLHFDPNCSLQQQHKSTGVSYIVLS